MMNRFVWMAAGIAVVAAGCAGPRAGTMPVPRPLGGDLPSFHASRGEEGKTTVDESPAPQDAISLDAALSLALMRNPELAAFSYDVRAAEARVLQSRKLPNPELEVEVEEFDRGGESFDSAETTIALGQVIELGGKRRWRTRMAEAEGELAGWDYESKRLGIFAETAKRFMAIVAAQRRLELAQSAVGLAEKTSHAVGERVKGGKEPPLQASKASAELELARLAAQEAESTLAVKRKMLAAMWGDETPHFQRAEGDLNGVLASVPPMAALRSRISANPELARWDSELRRLEAALSSEKAGRIPDLQARIGVQRFEEDGTDALAFGIGVPLPLFDRNQGNISAAYHELAKARAERRAAQTTLVTELAEAHADLTSAHRRALALRAKVVPAMEEAFNAAHAGYSQGKFGFLDMLDAQRGLFDATGELVDALADYHIALAEIQRLTGTSIEELMGTEAEETR